MKPKAVVSYFPVTTSEQALLARIREPDLDGRTDDLLEMLGQLAEARLTPADVEQAIQLLLASRQGEALEARFENLEARLKERIDKGLAEIEGRLSRRLGGEVSAFPAAPPAGEHPTTAIPPRTEDAKSASQELPREASLAFRLRGELVWGPSAAQFYVAVWRWLFEHGHIRDNELPIQSGKARYAVASTPVHPSGKKFTRAEQLRPGVYAEVNLSRGDIIRRTKKYLESYDVPFEVVVGAE